VALYAGIPMVAVLGGWAYTDLALVFYQMAALYALLRWLQQARPSWIALAGVFCGLALGSKYTAFLCPLYLLLALLLQWARRRHSGRETLSAIGLLCGTTALVAAPWVLRNLAWTGNPVYPFAYRWLGATPTMAWDSWRAAWYTRPGSGLGRDAWAWFLLPWTLTLGIRDMNFYDGRLGPLFLLALPFLVAWGLRIFGKRGPRPPALSVLIGFGLIQYVAWTIGVVNSRPLFQTRLLLSALVALCGPIVYVYHELRTLDRPRFSLHRLIGLSVALVLALNLCDQFLYTLAQRPLPMLVGLESQDDYLARNLGTHYQAMQVLDEHLAETDRALFLWEPRSYYCRVAAEPDAILDRWPWLVSRHNADLNAIDDELRSQGYTHILYHRAGADLVRRAKLDPWSQADWAALDRFLDRYLVEQAQIGQAYVLYALH
jgi:4-amino-4-deoxy-L-arabinose transferase-like glycosyltransferase